MPSFSASCCVNIEICAPLIRQLEIQGVISKTRSPFNSPIWPVRKSNGEWRLTVDYCGLNEVRPPLSAAMPDMLELQCKLESKAAKCLLGEGDIIRLALDKPRDDVPRSVGWVTSKGPQPVALRCAGYAAAHLKSYGDESGAPEAIGIGESQIKHLRGRPLEEQHKGNAATPASKSVPLGAQLKCLYTNTCSVGNKQEEIETHARLQGYDLIGITEMWWDGSYDWRVGMEGYRFFRKDRLGRQGGGVALYVNEQLECMELHLGMDEDPTKSLWVKIKGNTGAGDVTVGVCYRPPDQGDRADEALFRQIGAASRSQTLVLMGDFNHPDI
ncbi:hypothetical protein llap_13795 [Limosa lapponica baueri]|uniref:Endonuclease/exonuclease/phosphatase domain-containing protein n=1 Tax=Limosa lapponica baueri TaxID=1758121 RepID=A0A2I0TQ56_LIMLA|nr:hypothetical protein llap_13795 [Limosa lapponica baueri]